MTLASSALEGDAKMASDIATAANKSFLATNYLPFRRQRFRYSVRRIKFKLMMTAVAPTAASRRECSRVRLLACAANWAGRIDALPQRRRPIRSTAQIRMIEVEK